ncbi:MAG: hypothetical protein B7Z08_02265, partial [Sphingomonadales bacterium 32-68-7]
MAASCRRRADAADRRSRRQSGGRFPAKTIETGKVTFYSRSKQRLWTKGEESGHF